MGKIYEALERARKEFSWNPKDPREMPDPAPPPPPETKPDMEAEMVLLYRKIDTLLPGKPKRVIQFIGPRGGEGTSTIVWEFARVSASLLGKSVFLFDGRKNDPSVNSPSEGKPVDPIPPEPDEGEDGGGALTQTEGSTLPVCLVSHRQALTLRSFFSEQIHDTWGTLKEKFDLIVIDSPPACSSPDGVALSPSVDGVVLVLEAEKTRWPVAENLKRQITRSGGKVLGVVFNKRRYHIPEFLYRRL